MKYLWLSIKMQFRVPISIFFSMGFPLIMMIAMLASYGNFDIGNGFSFIDKYFLISTGIGMLPIALISLPIWLCEGIQDNSYKRMEYFGMKTHKMIMAEVFSYMILTFMTICVIILFGFLMYGLNIPSIAYLISFIIHALYANFVLFILGAIIALLVKKTNIMMPLGMTVLFTFYIFTGVFISFSDLPNSFQSIGKFIPMKYVMNDFFYIWSEEKLFIKDFLVLNTIIGIILGVILISILVITQKKKN